jgi:predicted  nucleic acid-binding Zn-ribbon protein
MTMSTETWDTTKSPYASLLHTNYVPSESELLALKKFLAEPKQELSRLDSEITHLQDRLKGLLDERDKVNVYIETHVALMAPARRLPAETVAEIFMRCLSQPYSTRSLEEAPLLLTRVCKNWRSISLL